MQVQYGDMRRCCCSPTTPCLSPAHHQKTLASLKAQWGPELASLKEETERRRRLMALTLKGLQEEEDIKVGPWGPAGGGEDSGPCLPCHACRESIVSALPSTQQQWLLAAQAAPFVIPDLCTQS
jgi:hypothetical protein